MPPVVFDGQRLPHGVAIEGWEFVRFPRGRPMPEGPVLERLARGVQAALAAREEHHRQWLRPVAGTVWEPWPAHKAAAWDLALKRDGLVAPLVSESAPKG